MSEIMPLRPGDPPRLGDYELRGRLGEGGQGVVYLGEAEDGERAAVKLLHVRFTGEAHARSRFARELAAARRVETFCTARVLAADLDGETPYIASELIDGPSLRRIVEREGPLAGEALEKLAIGTATALAAIHRSGIAHRDFKPDNVLLAPDGPRVVDFGIAKIIDESGTITTRAVGTPAYMAPEQIAGERVGRPADVFAWGSTMLFTATGKAPFGGDTIVATLNRVINHEPDLGALPEGLRAVVGACLRKDQARRPTADEVLRRLLGHLAEEGAEVSDEVLAEGVQAATADLTRDGVRAPARGLLRRRPVVLGGAAAAVAGLAAAFAVLRPDLPSGAATAPAPAPPAVSSPAPSPSTGSPLLDRIARKRKITIGYRGGLPGVALGSPPAGFEIDVARRIAAELGVPADRVVFKDVSVRREAAVESGEVDLVVANLSIDARTRRRVAFAGPYYLARRDVLVRGGSGISSPEDLRGRRLCVPQGSTTAALIRDRVVGVEPVEADDMAQCAAKVADGTADALPGDDLVIAGFGARLNGRFKVAGLGLTREPYGVAFRQGDPKACAAINEAVAAMYADGSMRKLLDRHFGAVDFRFATGRPRPERCR
ncbi:bifunctional serine/threonine-protein kinase/glutamate ABC transporter substrate-binding protein [Planomonospora sp. ID82291]|uniref:bifunctional serine/threonine-protein kinase/glutamate ABC transporter substrate-binding protein n=1 Tax=Planomonospora sp. ID82291 TaxID=2738136 RepID=UPI0018C440BE|nr:bifunctional serine/threonine-protein kinase/glutamate ABC transporter substrate-binding protein [Planomonospora sp. ID82291]MBG0812675.1 transporter substrate-binding domain-containing protein [Planomonospora sp. ID82291]